VESSGAKVMPDQSLPDQSLFFADVLDQQRRLYGRYPSKSAKNGHSTVLHGRLE
jgi:hypothetical protein